MTEARKTGFSSYAAAWLVAAAFGFSIYVVGLVFYGEDYAWLMGIAAFVLIGIGLTYIFVTIPLRLHEKIAQEERIAHRKLEEEKAAKEAAEEEPEFDWEDTELELPDEEETGEETLDGDTDGSDALDADESAEEENPEAGKPVGYASPEGDPDDLKMIKGIGPKLEEMLNSHGFYHFAQIADWGEAEIAWMDENLEGFKGRVSRDDWVAQASALMEGGEDA